MANRVLYVNTPTYLGGAEISLLTLMKYLDPVRFVPVLLTTAGGALSRRAEQDGIHVTIHSFPWFSKRRPWEYVLSISRLMSLIRAGRIDLVHTNCDHSLMYVASACRLAGIPYVSHVRDCVRDWFAPKNLRALNKSRRVIANSAAVERVCIEQGVKRLLLQVVYNPIELEQFSQSAKALGASIRSQLSIPASATLYGLIGQVEPIKGQEEFITAAQDVTRVIPEAHFLVVGEAPTAETRRFLGALQEQVQLRNLSSSVHFLGFRTDVSAVIATLDVLVVPSRSEYGQTVLGPKICKQVGFGRVVLEGMAGGCPVIASGIEGISEVVDDGTNGLIVPPADACALADAMLRLGRDSDLRRRLADEGRRTVQRFGARRHADDIQGIYDAVLRAC